MGVISLLNKKELIEEIERFRRESELHKYFDVPLVGYADAFDPLYKKFKEIIGDFHLTPEEIFAEEYPGEDFAKGTVISWILPVKESIRESNRAQRSLPTKDWAYGRNFGEKFNSSLRRHIQEFIKERGARSIAPMLSKRWTRVDSKEVGYASTWSERHSAYVAGLGTFGLCDGFISEAGKAHRCGSVITDVKLEPKARAYEGPYDNCLFHREEECLDCMKRCPAGAISRSGHDKNICHDYIREFIMPEVNEKYGVEMPGCGLCQVKVRCEDKNPTSQSG